MIRINLLAKKVSKKKAGAIQHLAIGAAAVAVLAVALGWVWIDQNGTLATLRSEIAKQEAEKTRLKNVNEEKNRFEKEKAELERKLAIITKLQKERIVPVHLLDELTRVIDAGTPDLDHQLCLHRRPASPSTAIRSATRRCARWSTISRSPRITRTSSCSSPSAATFRAVEVFRFSIKAGVEQPD